MISNYVLETTQLTLNQTREKLVDRKLEVQEKLTALGISSNQALKRSNTISEEIWIYRDGLVREILDIDQQLIKVNIKRRENEREKSSEKNKQLINVFKELFTFEQMDEIKEEAERRRNGEHPFALSFSIKDCIKEKEEKIVYKKLIIEQLDKMISFRILLTGLIDKGCEQFGKSEFLQFISPLNRHIIPVEDLKKIKRKIIG